MNITNTQLYSEFINKENMSTHASLQPEFEFYQAIKDGNLKQVQLFCKEKLAEKKGLGTLSKNDLQNMKYHFVITTALVTRYCVEGGLDFHLAYDLSDYYIQTADISTTIDEISNLHEKMCKDFAEKMHQLKKHTVYSKHVTSCIDYIYDHLHTRMTVKELADYVGLSPSYLSRIFQQEVAISISEYIQNKKLETSKNMLEFSDYSISEIAAILAYPSHSYFSEFFKKATNLTPTQYRDFHFRKLGI